MTIEPAANHRQRGFYLAMLQMQKSINLTKIAYGFVVERI